MDEQVHERRRARVVGLGRREKTVEVVGGESPG
jgi:hypothetical protein